MVRSSQLVGNSAIKCQFHKALLRAEQNRVKSNDRREYAFNMVSFDKIREPLMSCERDILDEGSIIHEAYANETSREEDYLHHPAPFFQSLFSLLILTTSFSSLFTLLGSPLAGYLADIWGRRKVFLLAVVVFPVGALIQVSSFTVVESIFGRAVIELAIGVASFMAPLYITKILPAPFRGKLVIVNVLFITIATIESLIMITMPEMPRWLVMSKRDDEAKKVLCKVYGARNNVNRIVYELTRNGWHRRMLIISCLLQASATLRIYMPSIFAIFEFESLTFTSLAVDSTNFLMTCVTFLIINRIGRHYIILYTITVIILRLLLCSLGSFFMSIPTFHFTSDSMSSTHIALSRVTPLLDIFSIILFLFPHSVRALGSGIITITNWTANFIFGLRFLLKMEFMSPTSTFITYAAFCVLG
ncbi:MFS myo-inositol transporter/Myo-inositol transporter [Blumeria hordei DH14]|uniref:MFS myo-inositol transporter/Myo-inositol transporter n=1 Tax=Blumeria graminis f. sp. hordei (strain DH14) TaxID=546991 RepID=N1JM30_BLUG1|nr:MFS myo-inositol transporter/Myo-inositol transporter [Blumeria hordei DH14]